MKLDPGTPGWFASASRISIITAYPKTVGDWLILRRLRSKMCLSPSPREVLG